MTAEIQFDASEIEQLTRAIANLPGEIKAKAMGRAMRRITQMARTRVVRQSAERLSVSQAKIRKVTTAHFNAGGNTIEVIEKSGWISLYELGATQTSRGVRVRGRGSYKSAFIAEMESGHRGVMKRVGKKRLPIRELFGPNPAHDVTNNPEAFMPALAEVIEQYLLPRVLHELDQLLPR